MLEIDHIDVETAYLEAPMLEEVFVKLPLCVAVKGKAVYRVDSLQHSPNTQGHSPNTQGHSSNTENHPPNTYIAPASPVVARLQKSLYGLKQSGRNWFLHLDGKLKEIGLRSSTLEPGIYFGKGIFLLVWVDDICVIGDRKCVDWFKREVARHLKIKDLGPITHLLGMRIVREGKTLTLYQDAYVRAMLHHFHMQDSKAVGTPIAPGTVLSKTLTLTPDTESLEDDTVDPTAYQELVGSVLYASIIT